MIHLEDRHLDEVRWVLARHVPECDVYAFGSRATGERIKKFSDLDLVVMTEQPLSLDRLANLKHAFSESNLPIQIDVVDWASLSESFRKIIEPQRVLLREKS